MIIYISNALENTCFEFSEKPNFKRLSWSPRPEKSKCIGYIIEAGQVVDKEEFVKALTTGLESTNEEKIMRIIDHFKPEIYQEAWVKFEQLKGCD